MNQGHYISHPSSRCMSATRESICSATRPPHIFLIAALYYSPNKICHARREVCHLPRILVCQYFFTPIGRPCLGSHRSCPFRSDWNRLQFTLPPIQMVRIGVEYKKKPVLFRTCSCKTAGGFSNGNRWGELSFKKKTVQRE